MKKIFNILFFTHLFCIISFAQKHDNIWIIGGYDGKIVNKPDFGISIFDFSKIDSLKKYSPEAKGGLKIYETCANICDKSGNIAFYTNGDRIENWEFDTLVTQGHLQHFFKTPNVIEQGSLILPFPEKDSLYLMLYQSAGRSTKTQGIEWFTNYNIVDMSKNDGKGIIIELKKKLPKSESFLPCYGKLTAVKQPNGTDWWFFIIESEKNIFHRYQLTKTGLVYIDKQIYGNPLVDGVGAACFSPNGKYHARYSNIRIDMGQYLDVYDFDRCTGSFSNQRSIKYVNHEGAGVAFSASSRFLYASIGDVVLQYDMEAADFKKSEKVVAKYDGFISCNNSRTNFYNCQLAPDNKIYICSSSCTRKLHVIEKPDLPDTLCSIKQHSIDLPTYTISSLPNFPNFRLGKADCMIMTEDMAVAEGISIYPNPSQDILNVQYEQVADSNFEIFILNTTGYNVFSAKLESDNSIIDINHLSNGMYQCVIMKDGKIFSNQKLVIIK